jgi:hypothetical protein
MEVSGQLHAPTALLLRERAPATQRIGGWVGSRAILDAVVKRKILSPHRESNPRTPIVQPIAHRYVLLETISKTITAYSSLEINSLASFLV